MHVLMRHTATVALLGLLSACTGMAPLSGAPVQNDEPLVKGPAVTELVTPFDRALACLDGRINKDALSFAVGAVTDATGKEQVTDGGAGKFITQGAGDIVQSALFKAGASVVNRRDPRIIENEAKWGLIDVKKQAATTFFITGSINSLDFLPGSGFDVQIAGLGPRSRQQRILVGLDLSLTDVRTGRIVANVPLQKQVVSTEDGFGIGRFFGTTLISADFGGKRREALNLVLRQMLNLATFELLTQVMNPAKYVDCMAMVDEIDGTTDGSRSRRRLQEYLAAQAQAASVASSQVAAKTAQPTAQDATAAPLASLGSALPAAPADSASAKHPGNGNGNTATPRSAQATAALAADPNASPAAQAPFFSEEQSSTPRAALQALGLLPAGSATAPGETGNAKAPARSPATATATAAPVADACPFPPGDFPPVTPLRARGPGSSLLVRSRSAQTLCVADASGRFVAYPLVAGAERRIEGRAPWRLQAERLADLVIVYQGLPLRLPAYLKDRLELLERPWAPAG